MANDLDLAPHPEVLAETLKDVMLQAVIDPVQGVRIEHYPATSANGGFVACLIPEGNHKPYRAQLDGGSEQYYQRIGDSIVFIPHSLLRSLFYPTQNCYPTPTISQHEPLPCLVR
jgi:hypothetical protein